MADKIAEEIFEELLDKVECCLMELMERSKNLSMRYKALGDRKDAKKFKQKAEVYNMALETIRENRKQKEVK